MPLSTTDDIITNSRDERAQVLTGPKLKPGRGDDSTITLRVCVKADHLTVIPGAFTISELWLTPAEALTLCLRLTSAILHEGDNTNAV